MRIDDFDIELAFQTSMFTHAFIPKMKLKCLEDGFAAYAMKYWTSHLGKADALGIDPKFIIGILQQLGAEDWERIPCWTGEPGRSNYGIIGMHTSILHILSAHNISNSLAFVLSLSENDLQRLFQDVGRDKNEWLNTSDVNGNTPLILASKFGYDQIVTQLLDAGARAEVANASGWTALHFAARGGHYKIVKTLLNRDPRQVDLRTVEGWSPLDLSIQSRFPSAVEVIEALLSHSKHGAHSKGSWFESDSLDLFKRQTPLTQAAHDGNMEIVKVLLTCPNLDPSLCDDDGNTILHGYMGASLDVVRVLIQSNRFDLDATNNEGQTPLAVAAIRGDALVAQELIETGRVEVDALDEECRTPLMHAMRSNSPSVELVRVILASGQADVFEKSAGRISAFDQADQLIDRSEKRIEIAKMIQRHANGTINK